jgi:hypothetical protein
MKNTSTSYDENFRKKIMPKVDIKISHEQVNSEVVEQTVATVTNFTNFSNTNELFTGDTKLNQYSSCEHDRHVMDGSYHLVNEDIQNDNIGGMGSEVSTDGIFNNYPTITYELTEQVSTPFYAAFDINNNEYAVDFDIIGYQNDVVISTINITNNSYVEIVTDIGIQNYDKVQLIIKKWSKSNRRVRVAKFQTGVVKRFANDTLGDVKIFEQYSPTSLTVSSNNILFIFADPKTQYNPLVSNGWATYLQKNQKIIAEIGVNGEYVLVGTYFLTNWNIGDGLVTLEASDAISLTDVVLNYAGGSKTLYQHAVDIFTLLGITDYILDSSLLDITVTVDQIEKNGRELLRALAIASRCAFYADRQGFCHIEPAKTTQYPYVLDFEISDKPKAELQEVVKELKFGDYIYNMNETGTSLDIDNTFIADNTHAQGVAAWLESYLNKRLALVHNARPNPKIETGDIFGVQTQFQNDNVNAQLLINTMTFKNGGLLAVQKVKVV